jgi:hypothetical protein
MNSTTCYKKYQLLTLTTSLVLQNILLSLPSVFRQKHGVLRNEFVDFIMELRKRGKNEAKENTPSTKNPKQDATFRKFKCSIRIREREREQEH